MSEVIELASNDIDRSGAGLSTSNGQAPVVREDGGQAAPAEMSADQRAGIQKLAEMRTRYGDGTLSSDQREALMARMSELSRHVFTGTAKPAWFGEQTPDARATSMEPYDPMSDLSAKASATMTQAERDQLIVHGKVKGLDAAMATEAVEFCTKAGLDKTTSRIVTDRLARHQVGGFGIGEELSAEDHAELQAECVRRFGSQERAAAESSMARAYLEHVKLDSWADTHSGSLQYDPTIITMLAYKARCLGITAVK